MLQAGDLSLQLRLHLVVGLLQKLLPFRVLHDVPDALALGDLQLLLELCQKLLQIFRSPLGLGDVVGLLLHVGVELLQHGRGGLHDLLDVFLHQPVQGLHPDVVAGAGLGAPAVIEAAAVGVLQIGTAHGEHGAAAVAALQKAGVHVVVLLDAPVVRGGSGFPQRPGRRKGPVIDDGLVVVFKDKDLIRRPLDLVAVDLGTGGFPLP